MSFFFQKIVLLLDDAFEGFSNEFSSVFQGEKVGLLDDFSVRGVFGGGPQVAEIGFGLFEEESFGFVLNFFDGIFLSWHGNIVVRVERYKNDLANITYLT